MIGIVVVSHSRALAEAAVELARQMGGASAPPIAVAAGAGDGLGTDAVEIAAAIDHVAEEDGVLVVMDLGSAILSAEMALELRASDVRVVLTPAPFVEGLVSAVVLAAAGADLDAVHEEVGGALEAKRQQLAAEGADAAPAAVPGEEMPATDEPMPVPGEPMPTTGQPPVDAADARSFDAVIRNPSGLHARPAAEFVRTARRFDAEVTVSDLDTGADAVPGGSLLALLALGIRSGARVRITARGEEAEGAIAALRELVESGFGEL